MANAAREKPTGKENLIMFLKFIAFSLGAGLIEMLSFTLLNEMLRLDYWVSYFIALVLSVLYNFTVNRRYTFKSAKHIPTAMLLVAAFYLVFIPYSVWLVDRLTRLAWNEYLVVLINMVQNLILEFLWCRFVIYRKSINTKKSVKADGKRESAGQ